MIGKALAVGAIAAIGFVGCNAGGGNTAPPAPSPPATEAPRPLPERVASDIGEFIGGPLGKIHDRLGTDWTGFEAECESGGGYHVNARGFCVPVEWGE